MIKDNGKRVKQPKHESRKGPHDSNARRAELDAIIANWGK